MKRISFYGDSFCATNSKDSWCNILAYKLDAEIYRFGVQGSSIWQTFLEFEKDKIKSDFMFFCWTEPSRLYHPTLPLTFSNKPIEGTDINVWDAATKYYRYLSYSEKDEISYKYALSWFDKSVLSKYNSSCKIIQTWSIVKFPIYLDTGFFLNETCMEYAQQRDYKKNYNFLFDPNHLTIEQNQNFAEKIYKIYKNNWID